jgi:hypothetical protein
MEAEEVVAQVDHHDEGDEPVVVVDPALVNVVLEPVTAAPRSALHHRDEHRAQVDSFRRRRRARTAPRLCCACSRVPGRTGTPSPPWMV